MHKYNLRLMITMNLLKMRVSLNKGMTIKEKALILINLFYFNHSTNPIRTTYRSRFKLFKHKLTIWYKISHPITNRMSLLINKLNNKSIHKCLNKILIFSSKCLGIIIYKGFNKKLESILLQKFKLVNSVLLYRVWNWDISLKIM